MNKLKIAVRNLKVNKVKTGIYLILIIIIVCAQFLSYASYQQYNEKYNELKYDLRRHVSLGLYEESESDYRENPYLNTTSPPTSLITEEEYKRYKDSDLIESSNYNAYAHVVTTPKATRKEFDNLTEEEIHMYEWGSGGYEGADPDSYPSTYMGIFTLSSKESLYGMHYDYTLVDGVDTLKDGEVLLSKDVANQLRVSVGDSLPIHQPVYVNGDTLATDDYKEIELLEEQYVDYTLKVVGIYKLDFKQGISPEDWGYDETYSQIGVSFTTTNTIVEYDKLVQEVSNDDKFQNYITNESYANTNVELVLKNPKDKQKLQDELYEKGLNNDYAVLSVYDGVSSEMTPIMNVRLQLQVACIITTIIAILILVSMMIYDSRKRNKETTVLYLLGYSKKDIWQIMFIEKLLLLLVAAVVAIIVVSIAMRELLYYMNIASYEHYYVDMLGYDLEVGPDFVYYWSFGGLDWDSVNAFVNLKVGLQPLHYLLLVVVCMLEAFLISGDVLIKKISDYDFLGRK
ncbi:FtsX-like permease family protein [Breznakia pachnodae]|uniref:ABC-type lipoprotein release transport system permease subunit n=1 Tax=Breznakia pachnodae TaxID=265178 RepID=A0ABU0E632_9FIRM|nr:FtsX-like permease family protein [Breznakia pachnodae]MDQ0362353.1 ABC-type lipoprotein release transport system permease subunit [Breznakia pachnodae]